MVVRDSIALGAVTGVVGTIPGIIINYISYQLGFSKYYSFQISSGTFLLKGFTDTLSGFVLGGIIWLSTGAVLGILIVFLLQKTGTDYWWLKGLLVSGVVMYTIIYGFLFSLGGSKVAPRDLGTNFTVLLENILFGLTTAFLIVRWGHKDLLKPRK